MGNIIYSTQVDDAAAYITVYVVLKRHEFYDANSSGRVLKNLCRS